MAFLNRAVAINSIVRVILWMLRIDLRRLSRALALAMPRVQGSGFTIADLQFAFCNCISDAHHLAPFFLTSGVLGLVLFNRLVNRLHAGIVQVPGLGDLFAYL